jgi:hypothetical protein
MSIVNGPKIATMVSAANGDTYGDGERHQFRTWQGLVQANVISMNLATAPVLTTVNNGNTYVVAGTGGGWSSATIGQIAYWAYDAQDGTSITPGVNVSPGAWEFYTPLKGWEVYDNNTNAYYSYNGTTWVLADSLGPTAPLKQAVVAASSTTINPALGNSVRVALNNIASVVVTISAGVQDGQELTILWVQGGTTPSTVTVASNVHGFTTPTATANAVSCQTFTWDATLTTWYAKSTGSQNM